jgi:tripartite-type tricarboxylate transporter receptor subunit TctC
MTSRKVFLVLGAVLAGVSTAAAQSYPARPVTLVNPFAAGGPVDAVARIMSTR